MTALTRSLFDSRPYTLHTGGTVFLSCLHPLTLSTPVRVGRRLLRRISVTRFLRLVNWPSTWAQWIITDARYDDTTHTVYPLPDGWTATLAPADPYDERAVIHLCSPDGHRYQAFANHRGFLSNLTPLSALPAPAPSTNTLRALLGTTFHCQLCGRQHDATNPNTWTACSQSPPSVLSQTRPGAACEWTPDIEAYTHRLSNHSPQAALQTLRLSEVHPKTLHDEAWALMRQLRDLTIQDTVPAMRPEELSDPLGLERYTARAQAWLTEWNTRIAAQHTLAAPVYADLERLLPLPHPVGSPIRFSDGTFHPSTLAELQRIQTILSGHGTVTVTDTDDTLFLEGTGFGSITSRRGRPTPAIRDLRLFFSVRIPSWWVSHDTIGVNPNALGLDPAFWQDVTIARGVCTFHTQSFVRQKAR